MATLTVEEKAIIQESPINRRKLDWYREEFAAKCIPPHTPASSVVFADIVSSAAKDKDIYEFILDILGSLAVFPAARRLPSHNSPLGTLGADIRDFFDRFKDVEQLNKELVAEVLKACICSKPDDDDESIWVAAYELVSRPIAPEPQIMSSSPVLVKDGTLRDLRGDWTRDYFPGSLEVLQKLVRNRNMKVYYSKALVFLQSSGVGKSRLADAFGETCLMISFNLRRDGTIGYPPADIEILDFMQQRPSSSCSTILHQSPQKNQDPEYPKIRGQYIWNHSIVVSLLRAGFEYLDEWVQEQKQAGMSLRELAEARHRIMAPIKTGPWNARSTERIKYCGSVVTKATIYLNDLVRNETWRGIFNKDGKSDIRRRLLDSVFLDDLKRAVQVLLQNLPGSQQEDGAPSLVAVFDEASSLLFHGNSDKLNTGLYVALNRIFSCLRDYNLWFFVLSTESQVEKLLPPEQIDEDNRDASSREALGTNSKVPLKIFPPFLALQLDVEDRRLMMFEKSREEELSKAMTEFSTLQHMRVFGRPLWFAYTDLDKMMQVAAKKLIGGKEGPYDPKNVDQVFATLSFRISLDLCLENPRSLALAQVAVNYHMRILMAIHQDIEALDTFTPSEPILSEAAIRYLCEPKTGRKEGSEESDKYEGNVHKMRWSASIKTLAQKLLQGGLIAKGTKGELYSRLILILARDCVHLDSGLHLKPTSPFTVREFLVALYSDKYHESICAIEPRVLNALMNFNHFTTTDENLHLNNTAELCHDLLRRSAALQLAPNQPLYDHLIPVYFSTADEVFKPPKCGVIVVQVKNKEKDSIIPSHIFNERFDIVRLETELLKADPSSIPRARKQRKKKMAKGSGSAEPPPPPPKPKYFSLGGMNPILLLVLDLGISKHTFHVQVSRSRPDRAVDPCIWAIHSKGHGASIFRCIETIGCRDACKLFFASAVPRSSEHDELARRNKIFYRLDREFRYKTGQEERVEGGNADQDKDVLMADV
ncbi:MAG: hypothetical protein M1813_006013 [Trichoglossum hirsutum]|nr:MAG: hypothetical protein M1813_006013 [Trichoglossum hirsutum]